MTYSLRLAAETVERLKRTSLAQNVSVAFAVRVMLGDALDLYEDCMVQARNNVTPYRDYVGLERCLSAQSQRMNLAGIWR